MDIKVISGGGLVVKRCLPRTGDYREYGDGLRVRRVGGQCRVLRKVDRTPPRKVNEHKIRVDVERMVGSMCCGNQISDFNEFHYDGDPQELADKIIEYIMSL